MSSVSPQDPWVQVSEIVRLVRSGEAQTRPELADATRLGRNIITQRIQAAAELGLVRPSGQQRSRGGRAADVWEFHGDEGRILTGVVGSFGLRVALTDLDGRVVEETWLPGELTADPVETSERMAVAMEALMSRHHPDGPAWGVGIGLPTPVDFLTGRSTSPVTAGPPGATWPSDFDIRRWFTRRMQAPVWVDSNSNLSALGAAAAADAPEDLIVVRMERGVGSGIVSDGRLHRGADWIAGEITHVTVQGEGEPICLCGRVGCLDAYASRWAIEAEAVALAATGASAYLTEHGTDLDVVVAGAEAGDLGCARLVLRAADAMGRALAALVTWFNPRRVVIGGNVLAESSLFQSAVGRTLHMHALAASVQHLEVRYSTSDRPEELQGAAAMVLEVLLSAEYMAEWAPAGFPIDVEVLLAKHADLLA